MTDTVDVLAEGGGKPRRVVDAPLEPPSADQGLLGVFRRRYLLRLLVRREIAARYQGSFLGLLWSYLNPLSQFLIFWLIIGTIFQLHDSIENFAIHIFSALIIVHYFNETLNAGTRSIVRNKALVKKLAMPREMFPVASMLVSLYHVFPQLVILVIACLLYGWTPTAAGVAAFAIALLLIMILGTAIALALSAANVFFRDVGSMVNIVTNLVRFGVPMIYSYEMVGERFGRFADYYVYNPIADAVMLFQQAFWAGTTKDPQASLDDKLPPDLLVLGLTGIGISLVLLVVAQLVFSKLENRIPDRLT
jgi:ABC-2 type transport system permease protein